MIQPLAREKKLQQVKDQLQKEKLYKKERDPVLRRHHERLDIAITQQLTGRQPRLTSKVGHPRKFIGDEGKFTECCCTSKSCWT